MRSRDFSMPPLREKKQEEINRKDQPRKTRTGDDALFIVRVKIIRGQKLIEQLMTPEDLQRTGLSKLTAQELANLNAWLDPSLGVDGLVVADSSSSK
jgi:hypothetical protein